MNHPAIGTSGYVFDDWIGPFYPKSLPRKDWLRYYAMEFSALEINATYYRIPSASMFQTMLAKTPPGFRFVVKANQHMTHKRVQDAALYRRFIQALEPLERAGRLSGVLFQFPFGFKQSPQAMDHLAFLRRQFASFTAWAEFRHASWHSQNLTNDLKSLDLGFCAVDEPALPGMMPPFAAVTNGYGYVRFHGRNADTWYGGGHKRYDWEYTQEELESWLDRIRFLNRESSGTFLFFNNCYMGRAVKSARLLRRLLGIQEGPLTLF